jgi:hypothetical protein
VSDARQAREVNVILHVWLEPHDPELRGRLVYPPVTGPAAARGMCDLCRLVRRALEEVQDEMGRQT